MNNRIKLLVLTLVLCVVTTAQGQFITTWRTDLGGSSCSACIEITTSPIYSYNYDIDWDNDGVYDDVGVTGDISNTYAAAGQVTIAIRGQFPAFSGGVDAAKLISVDQWGGLAWQDLSLSGCNNLISTPTAVAPDLSAVSSLASCFASCTSFNSAIGHWDVSNVADFTYMFDGASAFNQDLSTWALANAFTLQAMFLNASSFNQDLSAWDVSNIEFLGAMFVEASSFDQSLGAWSFAPNVNFRLFGATGFLENSGMSCETFSSSLIGWAQNAAMPDNLDFDSVFPLEYGEGAATAAYNFLTFQKGWNLDDAFEGTCSNNCESATPLTIQAVTPSSDGSVQIEVVDGSPSYEVSIDGSQIGQYTTDQFTISGLSPGSYTMLVVDAAFCADDVSFVIPEASTSLVISEIMYNPPELGEDSLEFVKITNVGLGNADLDGIVVEGLEFTFPIYSLPSQQSVIVCRDSLAFKNVYPTTSRLFEFRPASLDNDSELLLLRAPDASVLDSVRYDDDLPWPSDADGLGYSLVLCDLAADNAEASNWSRSTRDLCVDIGAIPLFASPDLVPACDTCYNVCRIPVALPVGAPCEIDGEVGVLDAFCECVKGPIFIGNMVWHDINGDGIQDGGEPGLPNIEVTIERQDGNPVNDILGNPIATTITTDAAGMYRFDNIPSADYTIIFSSAITEPDFFLTLVDYSGATGATDVSDDSDAIGDPGNQTGQVDITPVVNGANPDGTETIRIDAGFFDPVSLGDLVWNDRDLDGTQNEVPVEGIPGIQVFLRDGTGALVGTNATGAGFAKGNPTFTDGAGNYEFDLVPPGLGYTIEFSDGTDWYLTPIFDASGAGPAGLDDSDAIFVNGIFQQGITESFDLQSENSALWEDNSQRVDAGFYYFDCTPTNQQYLEDQCTTVDPTFPDHNTFFPICDVLILDQFCATMISGNSPGSQPSPLCANGGVPNNISWFSFVAGTGDYQIEVVPGNCTSVGGQAGISNGIYTDCTFSEEVQCQGQCSTAPIVMNSQDPPGSGNYQLEPCEVYFWFLDGCNGSVCDFEINVLGTFNQCDPDDPTNLICTGTASVDGDCIGSLCPGETVVLELEGFEVEGVFFNWSVTPDDGQWTINNSVPDFSIPTLTLDPFLDITFDPILAPGDSITYTVCWENLRSKCVNKDGPICKDVKVKRLDNEDFGTVSICEFDLFAYAGPEFDENGDPDPNNDGTLGWQCPTVFEPGVNDCNVITPEGCEYTQSVFIIELLDSEPERFDTVVCGEWEFLGVQFPAENWVERPFFLSPDILNANDCDTFIDLYAWYMNIGGLLTGGCITGANGQPAFALTLDTFDISDASPNNTTIITVDWYRVAFGVGEGFEQFDGDPDGNPFTFITDQAGEWRVIVTMTVADEDTGEPLPGCEFVFDIDVDPSIFLPQDPVQGLWNLMPCAAGNPPVMYTVTSGAEETPTWIWPSDVTSATGQGTDSLTIDWNGSAGGEIGVFVTNDCGVSDTITAIVTLIDVPDPVIAIDLDTTCVDSIFTITSVGPTIGGEMYTWGFSGGVVQGGPVVGPGPHQVSWPSVGDFEVTLQVNVADCESTIARDTVTTVGPIAVPVIICGGSTTNSASFTWDAVLGAIGYIVEVIQGPGAGVIGSQANTDYTATGLNLGDGVIIQVTAVTDNSCGNTVGTSVECFAQNCPPETITLTSANDTLCFDPALGLSTIDIAWADGSVPPGTGIFEGDGIDDPTAAAFNPVSAGIGTHTVVYTFTGTGADYTGCTYAAAMTFVIYETPTSDFTIVSDDICITEQSTLTYTGNTNNGTYLWTLTPDGGPIDGIGPHDITWPTAGSKSVELVVTRNGCVSTSTVLTAELDDLVEQVDVECGNRTATSIEFIWNDVANSSDFALIEDGSPIANQTTTTLTRTGLMPGTQITLIVEAISDNLCPGTIDTVTCIAQNCPDITLTLSNDTVVCSDVAAFDLTWSLTGGLQDGSGVGTWSGTGITDTVAGTFDPSVSGVGDFTITFDYLEGPGGSCTETATMEVSVIDLPVVDFTISDDTICLNETILVNYTGMPLSLRPQVTVSGGTLDASGNGRDFRWTFDTEGTYTILAEAFAGSCIVTPMMDTVVVLPTPDETVAIRCDSSNLDYIRFAWEALTCASTFEVFIDGVSVGVQSDLTYEITGLSEGDTRTIRVVPINECECATVNEGTETCEALSSDCDLDLNDDFVSVSPSSFETVDVLDNDNLPLDYIAEVIDISSDIVNAELLPQGDLSLLVEEPFADTLTITYEVCSPDCVDCEQALVYITNADLENIVQTTFLDRDNSMLGSLKFNNSEVLEDSELWIYNRWGQKIFYTENYGNDWEGRGYPAGIYFYVLKVRGVTIKQTLTIFN